MVTSTASALRPALFCLALLLTPAMAPAAAWEHAPRGFVALRDATPGALTAFVQRLEAAGGHASVVWASGAAVVYADDAVLARTEIAQAVASVHRAPLDERALAAFDPGRRLTGAAWNFALTLGDPGADAEPAVPAEGSGVGLPDAGPRPVLLARPPEAASGSGPSTLSAYNHVPLGADYYDTSEFMAGRVAVGVWLLDDAAPGASWTSGEISQTLGGVQAGLDNWVRKGGASAFLTFFIETHENQTVSGTPIQKPMSWDATWANEVMGNNGWTGANGFEKCFAYNHSIRDAYAANWCYSIFIADSNPSVNQGLFQGGGYAWAYYGGPWIYMSRYSTWAYNYSRYYAVVPMHESGHIFMSTDEYDGSMQYSGYLNVADVDFARCIMNQNDSTTVCAATRSQIGWRDLDGDGIIEPLDVPPDATLVPLAPDPTGDPTPTWSGHARVMALHNHNPYSGYQPPHDQTIARIQMVQCRVDGGPWSAASASDGVFDSYAEDFTWTPAPLAPGTHVIESRALTTAGAWTAAYGTDTVTVAGLVGVEEGGGPLVALAPPEPNPTAAGSTLGFTLAAPGFVRLAIASVDGRIVRVLHEGVLPPGIHRIAWNGRDARGRLAPPGVYLCRLQSAAGTAARRLAVIR